MKASISRLERTRSRSTYSEVWISEEETLVVLLRECEKYCVSQNLGSCDSRGLSCVLPDAVLMLCSCSNLYCALFLYLDLTRSSILNNWEEEAEIVFA